MIIPKHPWRLDHTTKPGRANKYTPEGGRNIRSEWAHFCVDRCPHPEKDCSRGTCKEFRAAFGDRRDN